MISAGGLETPRTRSVFDNETLLEPLRKRLSNQALNNIGRKTGRKA